MESAETQQQLFWLPATLLAAEVSELVVFAPPFPFPCLCQSIIQQARWFLLLFSFLLFSFLLFSFSPFLLLFLNPFLFALCLVSFFFFFFFFFGVQIAYVWYCVTQRHDKPSQDTKEALHASENTYSTGYELADLAYDFVVGRAYSFRIERTCPSPPHQHQNLNGSFALGDEDIFNTSLTAEDLSLNVSICHLDRSACLFASTRLCFCLCLS